MDVEALREYCLAKSGVTEGFPFGEGVLVFKVGGKMFALFALDAIPLRINLKCDPDLAVQLREQYQSVLPGYHMNKKLWNTVILDGSIPNPLIRDWIDHSYSLIRESLPKAIQRTLE